jgi:transcriptional regulator with XRE-family HTH domain
MAPKGSEESPKIRRKRALRMARVAAGKSVQEAAAAVGKSRQAYSAWERLEESAPVPDDGDLAVLAPLFGVPLAQLQSGEWITRYAPGSSEMQTAPRHGEESWSSRPLPRHLRHLPLAVREYLGEFRSRLKRGGASDEEITEALELMQSPQVFTFYKGGALSEFNEDQVLRGMKAIGEGVVIPELRERGRKIP